MWMMCAPIFQAHLFSWTWLLLFTDYPEISRFQHVRRKTLCFPLSCSFHYFQRAPASTQLLKLKPKVIYDLCFPVYPCTIITYIPCTSYVYSVLLSLSFLPQLLLDSIFLFSLPALNITHLLSINFRFFNWIIHPCMSDLYFPLHPYFALQYHI